MHSFTHPFHINRKYKNLSFIVVLTLILFIWKPVSATYHLYFINNTSSPIHYSSYLNINSTKCSHTILPSSYKAYSGFVKPYARAKLFEINYNQGIKSGYLYCFTSKFTLSQAKASTFNISMKLQGNFVGSSIVNVSYISPTGESQAIFSNKPRPYNVELKEIEPKILSWKKPLKLFAAAIHYSVSDQSTNELDYVLNDASLKHRYFRDQDPHSLTTATYNVQLWPFYSTIAGMRMNEKQERVRLIPKNIQGYDVVVVEELMDRDLRNKFIQAMSKDYPYHYGPTENYLPLTGGEMIFSHWPIIRKDSRIFQDCNGIDCLSTKGVLYAQIKKSNVLYNIFGSHTQATEKQSTAKADRAARDEQISEISNFITKQAIPIGQPVVIAGDLNVDYQACYIKGNCDKFKDTIEKFDPHYPTWSNVSTVPYGSDPSKNLMNTDAIGEMEDYIIADNTFDTLDKPQTSRIRIIREPSDPVMYDGGNLKAPYAELDLSDHFLFEKKMHFK